MSVAEQTSPVAEARSTAVAAAIDKIRAIESERGVNSAALDEIKAVMLDLAADRALFPPEDFPLNLDGSNTVYRLSEDPDHRFALYMSTGQTGKKPPPHDHTTWAVIVGLKGKEHNRFYQRTDDPNIPGRGTVEVVQEVTVEHGVGVTLMPDTVHSIHLEGEPPTLNLHMYGMAIDRLPDRVAYNVEDGTYQTFPPTTIV